jgi:hypothetical protein
MSFDLAGLDITISQAPKRTRTFIMPEWMSGVKVPGTKLAINSRDPGSDRQGEDPAQESIF